MCQHCGRPAFTLRGRCALCDPLGHAAHRQILQEYAVWRAAYVAETGRDPLADFDGFTQWVKDRQHEPLPAYLDDPTEWFLSDPPDDLFLLERLWEMS